MAHAEAYDDPGTPAEQTRRTFMAQGVIFLGGVIGLSLAVPLVWSLVPSNEAATDQWTPLTPDEVNALDKATAKTPVRVTFDVHETNGYFGATDQEQFVWAVRATEAQMKEARPELYATEHVPFPVVNMGFVVFSPICPHLGCKYTWNTAQNKFLCPCHGSVYSELGKHEAGPALRGLDPLPVRNYSGKLQVTWIEYQTNTPQLIVQKIG